MDIDIDKIERLSKHHKLVEFSSFVLSKADRTTFPDYLNFDLMEIARLVPHIFVFDVFNSTDKLRVKFCGTKIDEFYGSNMTGKFDGSDRKRKIRHRATDISTCLYVDRCFLAGAGYICT